jgi:hypothetical protein
MSYEHLPVFPAPEHFVGSGERVASSRICCADIYPVPPVFLGACSASKRPGTSVRLIHHYMETSARGKMDKHFCADANLDFLLDSILLSLTTRFPS